MPASRIPIDAVSDSPYPTWMEVIDTNLNGLFLVTQAALAVMKRGSTIVNNLSVAAEHSFQGRRLTTLPSMEPWIYRHFARRVAAERHSRHCPSARRDGYRDLGCPGRKLPGTR